VPVDRRASTGGSITTPALSAAVPVSSRWWNSRFVLPIAFAFSVMADPVSSVSNAIEAALRALDGRIDLLVWAMGAVVFVVALVVASYHQLVARFPEGGGAAAATGKAFGEGWSFVPMGALVFGFELTIAISVAAGSSAIISYLPAVAPYRLWLPLGLLTLVALLTLVFLVIGAMVLFQALRDPAAAVLSESTLTKSAPLAVILAFPVAMALAAGVEAPSSAIAQLPQLDDASRRAFGRWALWLTLGIVDVQKIGLAVAAAHVQIGVPREDTTPVGEIARAGSSGTVFAAFQGATALLLLSAASSSFQAGPGLLKALARSPKPGESLHGVLPAVFGRMNKRHVPLIGVAVFYVPSAAVVTAGGAKDQELALFYAVAVCVSFLMGLTAMAVFAYRERHFGWFTLNVAAAIAVAFTLVANLLRPAAIGS